MVASWWLKLEAATEAGAAASSEAADEALAKLMVQVEAGTEAAKQKLLKHKLGKLLKLSL